MFIEDKVKVASRVGGAGVVFSEEFRILASCLLSPIRRNSVLKLKKYLLKAVVVAG